jgi:hypothetical protein
MGESGVGFIPVYLCNVRLFANRKAKNLRIRVLYFYFEENMGYTGFFSSF